MKKVAVIIPYCNEWPQLLFTIRSVADALRRENFEILAVDNWVDGEVQKGFPGAVPDRAHAHVKNGKLVESHIKGMATRNPWLKYLRFDKRLSHWQAKNFAVRNTDADFLWFMDAHVFAPRGVLLRALEFYQRHWRELNGTLHLPLTYHILESDVKIYGMRWFPDSNELHYTFRSALPDNGVYEVPCMSTCGVLMHRSIYNRVGGWPEELGIYGGGENFLNFTMSVLGMKKFIFGRSPLYHHGDERGYRWNFWDYERNRMIATLMFGGEAFASKYAEKRHVRAKGGSPRQFRVILDGILRRDSVRSQRSFIEKFQEVDLLDWIGKWSKEEALQALAN